MTKQFLLVNSIGVTYVRFSTSAYLGKYNWNTTHRPLYKKKKLTKTG